MRMPMLRFAVAFFLLPLFSLIGCSGLNHFSDTSRAESALLQGTVHGGQQPVSGATIQLYAINPTVARGPSTALIADKVTTDQNGSFVITKAYTCPSTDTLVYLVARGGNPGLSPGTNNAAITEMAALGTCGSLLSSTFISINEVTTVGSIAALAPYMEGYANIGSTAADANSLAQAFLTVAQYTDFASGTTPGPALPPNYYASSVEINTLADILAACVNSVGGVAGDGSTCGRLFGYTTPLNGSAPTDTIAVQLNILRNPTGNVASIFGLNTSSPPFQPTLAAAPSDWSLPIKPIVAAPVFTPAAGNYAGTKLIGLATATSDASIFYTTDGSTPTANSLRYSGTFLLTTSTTIRAIAIANGFVTSAVNSAAYIVSPAGAPAKLAFLTQPTDTGASVSLSPSPTVAVEDVNGNIVTSANAAVTLLLAANPGGGALHGTLMATPVNGIATFSSAQIDTISDGYSLLTQSSGLSSATSASFNVTLPPIKISVPSNLVGIGVPLTATLTLASPAGINGLTAQLTTSDAAIASWSQTSVFFAAGASTATVVYNGNAPGTATLSAAATSYKTGTATVTATNSLLSLGTLPTSLAPGLSASLALSLGQNAPAGGVNVSFSSTDSTVATVTSNVYIPAGVRIAATNPKITATGYGATTITASAPGYAPDVRNVSVSLAVGIANIPTLSPQSSALATISLSAAAPVGGLTFALTSGDTSIVTVPATVTIPAGSTSAGIALTTLAGGKTYIMAAHTGLTTASANVTVEGTIPLFVYETGISVSRATSLYVTPAPSAPTTLTLTVSDPTIARISLNGSTLGGSTITVPSFSQSSQGFYVQGLKAGDTTLTISVPGYNTSPSQITVGTSGFLIAPNALTTNTLAAPTSMTAILSYTIDYIQNNPIKHTTISYPCGGFACTLNPGLSASVPIVSSDETVGTVSGPAIVNAGAYTGSFTFTPVGGGSTVLSPTQPVGFSRPLQTDANITVTAPTLSLSRNVTGAGLYVPTAVNMSQYSTGGTAVTVSIANPAILKVSSVETAVGSVSVVLPSVKAATGLYFQGQSVGSTIVTVSAPGYTTYTTTFTVLPSGFALSNPYSSFNTFAPGVPLYISPAILDANTLGVLYLCSSSGGLCSLNPGTGPFSLEVTSSDTTVMKITGSPAVFPANSNSANITMTAAGTPGTATIALGAQPAGFSVTASTSYLSAIITVTAPPITISTGVTGVGLTQSGGLSLGATSPSPVDLTITSSDPSVALIARTNAVGGQPSITFTGISSGSNTFYVHGMAAGTVTLTATAHGYAVGKATYTVYPSGLVLRSTHNTLTYSTTTFTAPNPMTVQPALLNSVGAFIQLCSGCTLSPGIGPLSIAITSSATGIGTINASPVIIPALGSISNSANFVPGAAGSTTVGLGQQPPGFAATTTSDNISGTITVTAPGFNSVSNITTGAGFMVAYNGAQLGTVPPSAVTITITSGNPSVAILSTSFTTVGSSSLSFTQTNVGIPGFYVQGLSIGNSTLTFSAPGYTNATAIITVTAGGFVLISNTGTLTNTVTKGGSGTLTVIPALLMPGTLAVQALCNGGTPCYVNPGTGPFSLTINSSAPDVVTANPATVTIQTGSNSASTAITYPATGQSVVTLGPQPTGFSATTTSSYAGGTFTVTQ